MCETDAEKILNRTTLGCGGFHAPLRPFHPGYYAVMEYECKFSPSFFVACMNDVFSWQRISLHYDAIIPLIYLR